MTYYDHGEMTNFTNGHDLFFLFRIPDSIFFFIWRWDKTRKLGFAMGLVEGFS